MKIKTRSRIWATGVCLTALLSSGAVAPAAEKEIKVKAGEFVIDPPTLINLGFEWVIQGDDNRNAKVEVSYRKQGEAQWKQGLPLMRLQGERIYQTQGVFDVISPNMFAGSILDLEPDTAYEARFVMSDPDGLIGQSSRTLTKIVKVSVLLLCPISPSGSDSTNRASYAVSGSRSRMLPANMLGEITSNTPWFW